MFDYEDITWGLDTLYWSRSLHVPRLRR